MPSLCRPTAVTDRLMRGMAYADPAGVSSRRQLQRWLDHGVLFAESLLAQ